MQKYSLTKKKLFNTYGATYTATDLILTISGFCIGIGTVCYLQKLNFIYSIIILISALCMIPLFVSSYFKYKYERKHFKEYCLYFESMKMFFKTYGKLIKALEETYQLFDEKSEMRECITKAIEEIKATGDYRIALTYVEEKYTNSFMERLHDLLVIGEKQGGESVYYNMDNINYQEYKEDITLYQNKKKSVKYMFYFMAIVTLGISIYSIIAYSTDKQLADILISSAKYQLYTFIELESILLLFMYIYISLVNKKWIRSDE